MEKIQYILHHGLFKKWYAAFGCLLGLSAFLSFGIGFDNWGAGLMGLLSSIYAGGLALEIHFKHTVDEEGNMSVFSQERLFHFLQFSACGLGCAFAFTMMLFFLGRGYAMNDAVNGHSDWVRAVWSFMVLKWAGAFLVHINQSHEFKTAGFSRLTEDEEP